MFFISDAIAQTAPATAAAPQDIGFSTVLMVLVFAVFYMFVIRPQNKRQKEHKALISGLNKGDEVLTLGGMIGKITEISDQYLTLQIATFDNKAVEVSVQRNAVQTLLPKGTMKSL